MNIINFWTIGFYLNYVHMVFAIRYLSVISSWVLKSRADPGFQVWGGGTHLKKLRQAEGGVNIFGELRVKNHDFTPKNHIFSNFRGGARRVRPPPGSAPENYIFHSTYNGLYSRSKILACRTNSLKNTKIKTLIIVI